MYKEYLQKSELLDESHIHILCLFLSNWCISSFDEMLKWLSSGLFCGDEGANFDETEKGYNVTSSYDSYHDCFVSFEDMFHYLEIVSKRYIEDYPDKEEIITKYLKDYKERYNLK